MTSYQKPPNVPKLI